LFHSDDLGVGKSRDRDSVGDAFLDRVHQVQTKRSEVTTQDHRVRVDNPDDVVNRVTQGRACALEHLQHRSLAFIDRRHDEPYRFIRSLVDQSGRSVTRQQLANSQQILRSDQGLQATIATARARRTRWIHIEMPEVPSTATGATENLTADNEAAADVAPATEISRDRVRRQLKLFADGVQRG
jgi:hypothetical protein